MSSIFTSNSSSFKLFFLGRLTRKNFTLMSEQENKEPTASDDMQTKLQLFVTTVVYRIDDPDLLEPVNCTCSDAFEVPAGHV